MFRFFLLSLSATVEAWERQGAGLNDQPDERSERTTTVTEVEGTIEAKNLKLRDKAWTGAWCGPAISTWSVATQHRRWSMATRTVPTMHAAGHQRKLWTPN